MMIFWELCILIFFVFVLFLDIILIGKMGFWVLYSCIFGILFKIELEIWFLNGRLLWIGLKVGLFNFREFLGIKDDGFDFCLWLLVGR